MVVNTGCFTTKELAHIAETAGSSIAITTVITIKEQTARPVQPEHKRTMPDLLR